MSRVLLIGCGKMGGAMLEGWLDRGMARTDLCVVEPSSAAHDMLTGRATVVAGFEAIPADFSPDIVVIAVKPQVMDQVLPPYARFAGDAVFLSIAAGRTIASFRRLLGEQAAIVRAMPNTPAAVRRGMTVAVASPGVGPARRAACTGLLEAVGEVAWVEDEALMDAVTAVSGSGPAYVFLLAEAMAAAGLKAGLPEDLAVRLARATVSGAGELLHQSPQPAEMLRVNVTSPGGTTAAALSVLMAEDGLSALMSEAVRAAAGRSRELAG